MVEIAPNVSIDPNVHHGAPVITGTRVPISILVGSLAGGMNKEDVSREYEVTIEQIEAALITQDQAEGVNNEALDAQLDEARTD